MGEYGAGPVQVLRDLIIDDFTPRHNIEVSLTFAERFVEAILQGGAGFGRRDSKGAANKSGWPRGAAGFDGV